MNIASFACNVGIGLWLVPYLVKHLGVAAYGLVPLAMIFTEYVSILTQSFNSAITRFLTVQLRGAKNDDGNVIFNSSLALVFVLSLLQLIPALYVLSNLDTIIAVPEGLLQDTVWLFTLTFLGFICSMFSGVFNVSMYSNNRLDLLSVIEIARLIVRLLMTMFLFSNYGPSLAYVGSANLLAGVVTLFLSLVHWRILTPELRIDLKKIELSRTKPISAMAGWIIINTVGYLLFLRIDSYIVNRIIGVVAGGEYAVVLQWSQLVRTAAGALAGVVTPLGMIYFARGEIDKLARTIGLAVKLMCLVLAAPLALLCAFSSDILGMWLGSSFRPLGGLMSLQLCTLVVNLGVLPLFSINVAANRIKLPAILTLFMGAANFVLAIWFVNNLGWGYYGVAFAGIIVLTLKNALFTPWYAARLLHIDSSVFFRPLISGTLAFLFLYATALWIRSTIYCESPLCIAFMMAVIYLLSIFPLAWFGLSINDREWVVSIAPDRVKNWCNKLLLIS